jgi:hypothetical protein
MKIPLILSFFLITIIHSQQACTVKAFSKETNEVLNNWNLQEYKITLVLNSAWSGPSNYRYLLYEKKHPKKQIGISYSGTTLDDDDKCIIQFKPGDGFDTINNYIFNKCENKITRL